MNELNLPHIAPIRFAKQIISREDKSAVVEVEFEQIPTLAMIVEASAQSSAAFGDEQPKMGFLVSLKNVKLLSEPKSLSYEVKLTHQHTLDSLNYFYFEAYDERCIVSSGVFIIALEKI